MNAPYTPDTGEVRIKYRLASLNQRGDDAEFNRWFAAVRAQVWDEGYSAGSRNMDRLRAGNLRLRDVTTNPYRNEDVA